MKKFSLICFISLLASPTAADHPLLPGATQIPYGSYWALGPTAYQFMQSVPVAEAIYGGQNAWQHYVADIGAGRFGGWSGYVSQGDCPSYPWPPVGQIGAYNFVTTYCGAHVWNGMANLDLTTVLAYVDWRDVNGVAGAGTKSISINLFHSWSTSTLGPAAGQFDLQGVVAHEFGHVFGFGHTSGAAQACVDNQNKDTMNPGSASGGGSLNICERSITQHEIDFANWFY